MKQNCWIMGVDQIPVDSIMYNFQFIGMMSKWNKIVHRWRNWQTEKGRKENSINSVGLILHWVCQFDKQISNHVIFWSTCIRQMKWIIVYVHYCGYAYAHQKQKLFHHHVKLLLWFLEVIHDYLLRIYIRIYWWNRLMIYHEPCIKHKFNGEMSYYNILYKVQPAVELIFWMHHLSQTNFIQIFCIQWIISTDHHHAPNERYDFLYFSCFK